MSYRPTLRNFIAGTGSVGPAAATYRFVSGSFAQGMTLGASAMTVRGKGSFAQGYSAEGSGGITAGTSGSFAQGFSGPNASISSIGSGQFVQGRASGSSASSLTAFSSIGTFVQGDATNAFLGTGAAGYAIFAQGAAKGQNIYSVGQGSFAQGLSSGTVGDTGGITANGNGVFAQGSSFTGSNLKAMANGAFAQGYTNMSSILAEANGAFAQGYAFSAGLPDFAGIKAKNRGSFAQGFINTGILSASGDGSFAQGLAQNVGALVSLGSGSFAQGFSQNGIITAIGNGSFAQGFALELGEIIAEGRGAFAHGYSSGSSASQVKAEGDGSIAMGYATILSGGYSIRAEAAHSAQFFPSPSSNNTKFSMRIGRGPHLIDALSAGLTVAQVTSSFKGGEFVKSGSVSILSGKPILLSGSVGLFPHETSATALTASISSSIYILSANAAREIQIPDPSTILALKLIIKDGSWSAATNPITVTAGGGGLIDNKPSQVITQNSGSLTLVTAAGQWYIV